MNPGGRGCVSCTDDLHEQLLWQVRRGRSVKTAAQLLGMSDRAVYRCARRHPQFRAALTAAIDARPGITLDHGRSRYKAGCRCAICRAACAEYARDYRRSRGLVSP